MSWSGFLARHLRIARSRQSPASCPTTWRHFNRFTAIFSQLCKSPASSCISESDGRSVQHRVQYVERVRPPLVYRAALRMSSVRHVDGLWIGTLDDESSLMRVEQALLLIKQYDRRRYDRIILDLERVWARLLPTGIANFNPALNACELDSRYVLADTTPTEMLAACIVHEATHARLWRCGIDYEEKLRERVEAACFRRELAFAAMLPDGAYVRYAAEHGLKTPPEYWRDDSSNERAIAGSTEIFRTLGIVSWPARSILTVGRWLRWLRWRRA